MQVRRHIKSASSAKKKLPLLLKNQDYRCLHCSRKMVRVSLVQKHRVVPSRNVGKNIRWLMPCGVEMVKPVATVDHIIPRWDGGTNHIDNLQALCSKCNGKKHCEETIQFKKRVIGICQKCGESTGSQKRKCNRCRLGDRAVVKIKNNIKYAHRPYKRILHIGNEEWSWQPGRSGVMVANPEGEKWLIDAPVLLNMTPDELDRAKRKRSTTANITPGIVKEYVERVIIKGESPSYDFFIMRGIPGSGKTTEAKNRLDWYGRYYGLGDLKQDEHIFSTDDYFYKVVNPEMPDRYSFLRLHVPASHKWNYLRVQNAFITRKTPIILDNCNVQPWQAKAYYMLALAHGYKTKIFYPYNDLWTKFENAFNYCEKDTLHDLANEFAARTGDKKILPWKIRRYMKQWVPKHLFSTETILESEEPKI